jgi:hypothetical protein
LHAAAIGRVEFSRVERIDGEAADIFADRAPTPPTIGRREAG